jgi:hypothetical protein
MKSDWLVQMRSDIGLHPLNCVYVIPTIQSLTLWRKDTTSFRAALDLGCGVEWRTMDFSRADRVWVTKKKEKTG